MQQQIRKVNVRQMKIKKPLDSLLTLTKIFIDNDPTKKLLKFMTEGNKKLRKHEMEMMKLMFGQLHPPSAMRFHSHSPSSNGDSSLFQQIPIKITSLQKEKDTPRIRILSTTCYKHRSRKHIILQSLSIKKIITSKQQMFYQFCSILINWKTARKTNV